jgi:putative transposase
MVGLSGGVFDHREQLKERLRSCPAAPEPVEGETDAVPASRWTLQHMKDTFDFLSDYSLSGISLLVRAAGIQVRHGRPQSFSPDPAYQQKEAALLAALRHVGQSCGQVVGLFVDELSYTRWPEPSSNWCAQAPEPRPLADRKQSPYQRYRVVGALNATSGRVHVQQDSHIDRRVFSRFVHRLDQAYPQAQTIYLIWDNWPVHHSDVVKETLAQLPRVHVIPLPTYSPWLNPIEKLWRKFRQEVDYLHPLADDWKRLRERVQAFFDQFAQGSADLLRYVGLSGIGTLASALHAGP